MTIPPEETGFDRTLIFTLPAQDARGRVVRLGPVLNTILAAHDYPPVVQRVLAEALVLTALLGSTLKDNTSQLTLQAQTQNGPISLLVCDYIAGQLRGYLSFDAEALAEAGAEPTLFGLFGKGFLALTFDQGASDERYQGIVPLEGANLGEAVENYFRQSEQVPTVARIAVRQDPVVGCIAAGVLIQQLPLGEVDAERLDVRAEGVDAEAAWAHVATIAETLTPDEMTDVALSMEALVWRLYHDEEQVLVTKGDRLARGCRCDPAYLASVLARFPEADRADMVDESGEIIIDCAFCSKKFAIDPELKPVSH